MSKDDKIPTGNEILDVLRTYEIPPEVRTLMRDNKDIVLDIINSIISKEIDTEYRDIDFALESDKTRRIQVNNLEIAYENRIHTAVKAIWNVIAFRITTSLIMNMEAPYNKDIDLYHTNKDSK